VLFLLSAAAAAGGLVLMLTYPRSLEGEQRREPVGARLSLSRRLALLAAAPGILPLFFQSVLFESQTRMLLKYYLQPFLKDGLEARGLAILGAGALWVGINEAVRDGLGGMGAWLSPAFERRAGGGAAALQRAYRLALLFSVGVGVCYHLGWMLAGLAVLVLLTILQNARRPCFVSVFNRLMDPPQRATSLSIESQARSLLAAVLLPVTGLAADSLGLGVAFALIAATLAVGLPLKWGRNR
jgi:hypothetical protein